MKYTLQIILVGIGTFLALLGAAMGQDVLFRTHMWIIFAALAIGTIVLLRTAKFASNTPEDPDSYMDGPVRYGAIITLFWGVVGFLVGVVVASQLAWPDLNIEPYLNFGRLRPLHTSAVIFAFGGNALLCTSFYVVQRTTRARLFGGNLAWFVFWGYNLFIVMAATGYLLGIVSRASEYAEPEWYVDIWITVVWVCLSSRVPWHFVQTQGAAYLRRQLVLPVVHSDHCHAASGQQHGALPVSFLGIEELLVPSPACRMP